MRADGGELQTAVTIDLNPSRVDTRTSTYDPFAFASTMVDCRTNITTIRRRPKRLCGWPTPTTA